MVRRARDRYRFVEQTLFFPTPTFLPDNEDEAFSYFDDHVLRLKRLFPGLRKAVSVDSLFGTDGPSLAALFYVPDGRGFGIENFRVRANKLWAHALPGNRAHSRAIDPVIWLEEQDGPFSHLLDADDDILIAYSLRMYREAQQRL